MNNLFKNMLFYYAVIIIPLLLVIAVMKAQFLEGWLAIVPLFTYVLLYRPYVDYMRLKAKGVAREFSWTQALGYPMRFFKELYWI